jgi:hypothetical protein
MKASAILVGSRALRTVGALALACAALLLAATGAGATATHPTATNVFGPDGTAASSFNGAHGLAINQANQHLFVYSQEQIYGFAPSSPNTRTPLGGAFPYPAEANSYFPSLAASPVGIYYFSGRNLYGINEAGQKLAARFPVSPPVEEGYSCGISVDGENNVWMPVHEAPYYLPTLITEFNATGGERRSFHFPGGFDTQHCAVAFNLDNNNYYRGPGPGGNETGTWIFTAASDYQRGYEFSTLDPREIAVDTATGITYLVVNTFPTERVIALAPSGVQLEEFAIGENIEGIAINEADDTIYVSRYQHVEVFPAGPIIPDATTEGVVSATPSGAVVSAYIDPAGGPEITGCKIEYGETKKYEKGSVPCQQALPTATAETVTAALPGLKGGRRYHYRIFAENENGVIHGADKVATVAGMPTIGGVTSKNVTESSAELSAQINPQGSSTHYFFEYGLSAQYGSVIPVTPEAVGSGQLDVSVSRQLTGLQASTYHFRVVAENEFGRAYSADQTFNFYPSECPNSHQRQQTGGSYLPDCRAYELVSPGNAGGIVMFPEAAPAAPYATNPARFPFGAALGVIPGNEGTNAVSVDTYIATRTDTGWVTHLGGLRGYEVLGSSLLWGDKAFDKVLDFREPSDFGGTPQPPDYAPFIWDAENNFLERWPANYETVPNVLESRGAYQPSGDFSHLAFSSNNVPFTKGGLEEAPGSAYDYNAATHTTTLISLLPNGEPIRQDPASNEKNEFIFFPGNLIQTVGFSPPVAFRGPPSLGEMSGVSEDGSHILMATTKNGYTAHEAPQTENDILYMRVNDAITYMVSRGKPVNYVGMTTNGGKVYFTTNEQFTPEDKDHNLDLYVWTEATDSIKLVSQGPNEAGQSETCSDSEWAPNCRIEVVQGEDKTDNSLASGSGDIYFYSPELLAGEEQGAPGQRNLYVYRNGSVHFVATFEDEPKEAVTRIQVSPNGEHMALLTRTKLNSYENDGLSEMYSFEPETSKLVCVSCLPDGEVPTSDVEASLDGLFMSNDGRTFFYTSDALEARDTDKIHDVYEYTEGKAQLITSGTAAQDRTQKSNDRAGGFSGVSADGVNAYFSTYETLVPQDENGSFQKFYDARVDGGFPYVPPAAACEAADECHGEGSARPTPGQIVSENQVGGGNVEAAHKKKTHKKKKHKKKAKRKQRSKRQARTGGKGR